MMEADIDNGGLSIALSSTPVLVLLRDLINIEPFKIELESSIINYDGITQCESVVCHIIRIKYNKDKLMNDLEGGTWWFGVEDGLPRKYERIFSSTEGKYFQRFTLSDIQINIPTIAEDFVLELPDDYSILPFSRDQLLSIGKKAPDWTLPDISGNEHTLSSYSDRVVVMVFWSTSCGWSRIGLVKLQELNETYKNKNVEVFAINYDEDDDVVTGYMNKGRFTFTTLHDGEVIADDYGVSTLPTFY